MKASKYLQMIGLMLSLAAVSCVDDTFVDNRTRVEEGLPASVQLGFQAEESPVITRAEQDAEYENRVDNIYVLVFDGAGDRHFGKFCTDGDGLSYADGTTGHNSGTVFFETTSLNDARIVGIANLTTATTSTAYSITKETLDAIQNLTELKALVMKMKSESVYRGALFMMTGYAKDKDNPDSEVVTIPGGEGSTQTLNATLKLERTDAKVKFVVKTSPNPPAGKQWTEFSFLPKTWTVKRVPMQSYVLKAETGDYDDATDAAYFSTPAIPFEEITRNATDANLYDGGSFVFYMPENKKAPLKEIASTGDANADYAAREAWSGEDEKGDKKFTNVNANSTYVEMTGTLSYKDNDGQQVSADVRFTVHLGYASGSVNDYDTERNGYYTYTITVRGIDDIIFEVTYHNDRRPGYEGDVVYSSDQIFEFDSHYDRRLITLNKSDIKDDMKWSVNTPFSRGIHEMKDEIPQEMRDYRWIKFAVNADYGVGAGSYVKYPGDQNYNDPYPMDASNNNLPSPYYQALGYGDARLRDIDQLIKYLQEEAAKSNSPIFDTQGNVAITVFVDENLYFNHPLTNEPGENNRSLWKLTADKEDRQMHIIAGGSEYSDDGNSSIVHSKFSFKQRTIRTIFNVDKEGLTTAWGLESTMETGRLATGDVSQGTDTRNGRANCLKWLVGKQWTQVLSTADHYKLNSGYDNAAYACMLRNRDLNGDNIIDANEVRWYLASIDQLTDIYLGEYALDEQSRLYPSNATDRENMVRWHYTSSSYNSADGNAWVLWAEEGASRGSYGDSYEAMDGKYSYRCVRNLGLSLDTPDEIPADLVNVTEEVDGNYLIDMTNMSVKARRTNYESVQLPAHNERDADNRPYAKFRVHANTFPEPTYERGYAWDGQYVSFTNAQNWGFFQTQAPYPAGYRIPNQRELLIMTTRMDADAWPTYTIPREGLGLARPEISGKPNYICQTAFSLDGQEPEYNSNRDGFLWSAQSGVFFLQNSTDEKGYVRPVQDVQ